MDPEPGRCRRTDGKKWRCYKSVVKDQKYCERHMHRGRQRSRKLVEGLENISKTDIPILNTEKFPSASAIANDTTISSKKVNTTNPTNSQLAPPSSNTGKSTPCVVNAASTSAQKANNCTINDSIATPVTVTSHDCKCESNHKFKVEVHNTNTCSSTSTSVKAGVANRSIYIEGNGGGCYHRSKVRVISRYSNGKEGCLCPIYGFSPKSVLQVGADESCRSLSRGYKTGTGTEAELLRCRRTDGKQWRCRRAVVHGQKYCDKHMNRGAKRGVAGTSNSAAVMMVASAAPPLGSDASENPFFIAKRVHSNINLNKDPSPLMAACPFPLNAHESTSSSSSSSDATTISD